MMLCRQVYRSVSLQSQFPIPTAISGVYNLACLTIGFIPTEGLRWSESQHSVSPMPRARGGDRDGTVAGASGSLPNILPNPNTSLNPNPVWSRQRELLMHLLPWYTAAAAAAQAQPGNCARPVPGPSSPPQETLTCMPLTPQLLYQLGV